MLVLLDRDGVLNENRDDYVKSPGELVMLPGYYHELLNEPPAERRRVLDLLDRWTDRWVAPPRAAAL